MSEAEKVLQIPRGERNGMGDQVRNTHHEERLPRRAKRGENVLEIATCRRSYGIQYSYTVRIEITQFGISKSSWIWNIWTEIERKSSLSPFNTSHINATLKIVQKALEEPRIRFISSLTIELLEISHIREFFASLLPPEIQTATSGSKKQASQARPLLISAAKVLPFKFQFTKKDLNLPPIRNKREGSKPLISDLKGIGSTEDSLPLGTVPFKDIEDLRKKIKTRVHNDLQQIRAACISKLKNGALIRTALSGWAAKKHDPALLAAVRSNIVTYSKTHRATIRKFPRDEIIGAYAFVIAELELARKYAPRYNIAFGAELREYLFQSATRESSEGSHGFLELVHRASADEVYCAMQLIQTYVGWNFTSVVLLKLSQVIAVDDGFEIQSIKPKTDDATPISFLSNNMEGIPEAMALLLWNLDSLKRLGHLSYDHQQLWVLASRRHTRAKNSECYFLPNGPRANLIKRYRLPYFSFDQVRTQKLFSDSLETGSIEAARRAGGHIDIASTSSYLDQTLSRLLSSATNFEFQRRLGKEIIYDMGDGDQPTWSRLIPVGDGTSCINPLEPPARLAAGGGQCAGVHCHTGGGCENRVFRINRDRMEEVARTRRYFEQAWQELWRSNPLRFEQVDLPAMLLNEGLHQALQAGTYAHLYRPLLETLAATDASTP